MYWAYRNRARLGTTGRAARDPVCGMQVEIALAPASADHDGHRLYFCSDHCAERFAERRSSEVPMPDAVLPPHR